MEAFEKKSTEVFQVGDKVLLVHTPRQHGDEMNFPAIVTQIIEGWVIIDTDYQKGIKVKPKDLRLI